VRFANLWQSQRRLSLRKLESLSGSSAALNKPCLTSRQFRGVRILGQSQTTGWIGAKQKYIFSSFRTADDFFGTQSLANQVLKVNSQDSTFEKSRLNQDLTGTYSLVEFWEPKATQEEFSAMLSLESSPTVLEDLSRVCSCEVFPDWKNRTVKIGANDRATIDVVVRKLRKVEEVFRSKFSSITTYLVSAENKIKFHFRFVSLKKQALRMRTTLFDSTSKWNQIPSEDMFSVRLMEYDFQLNEFKPFKVETGDVYSAYNTDIHRDWATYTFRGHEAFEPSPLPVMDLINEISQAKTIEPEDTICSYIPQESAAQVSTALLDTEEPTNETVPKATRRPRPRNRQGESDFKADDPMSLSSLSNSLPSSPRLGSTQQYAPTPRPPYPPGLGPRPDDQLVLSLGPRPTDDPEDLTNTISVATRRPRVPLHASKDEKQSAETSTNASTGQPESRLSLNARPIDTVEESASIATRRRVKPRTDDERSFQSNSAKKDPTSTAVQKIAIGTPETHSEGQSVSGFSLGVRPADVVEEPEPIATRRPRIKPRSDRGVETTTVPVETVESVSEVQSREIYRTVGQKKPVGKSILRKDNAEALRRHNVQKMNNAFFHVIEYTRNWSGHLELEARIGRLIFSDIPKGVRRDIEWPNWDQVIVSCGSNLKSTFTRILTTQHYDMEFIRDLKLAGGERLFSEYPISRRVIYEFEIEEKKKRYVLSVDAENNFMPTLFTENKRFAAVDMANPLHSWDYEIILSGKRLLNLKENVFINAIYNSLSCKAGELPDLSFVADGPSLHVRRVLAKLETRYAVLADRLHENLPLELVVTEVQNLEQLRSKEDRKSFRAIAKSRDQMKQDQRLQWTCSLVSPDVDKLLEGNRSLEVGETVKWTTEDILGLSGKHGGTLLLPSFTAILNKIIPKIDDVGSTNNAFD
jgi:hypothetical protein